MFDWDGTAVASRHEAAKDLAALLDELLRVGVWIVIVTGTNVGHIARQLLPFLTPHGHQQLLICTNRGSEVFRVGRNGQPVRIWLRTASPDEDRVLDAIAEAVRDTLVQSTGLEIQIVYDRLNRRKIDLIPLPEWADPPKDQIGELLRAVESRLRTAGWQEGIAGVVRLAHEVSRQHGLPAARITSDVKHVEVGLTDKGDAVAWVRQEVFQPRNISSHSVLIAGDEFGPIADVAGSDDRMRQELPGAAVVSVGREPNGVPPGVVHLGGGPERFRDLLAAQIALHQQAPAVPEIVPRREIAKTRSTAWLAAALEPPEDPAWCLTERGYRPTLEHEIESRMAISNGFLGVRGSLETPTDASRPRTYVAGLFDTPEGEHAVPSLVVAPDWLRLQIQINGQPLSVDAAATTHHQRTVDFRRGIVISEWHIRHPEGEPMTVHTVRWASLAHRPLAALLATIHLPAPASLTVEASLVPGDRMLEPVRVGPDLTVWQTRHSRQILAIATEARLRSGTRRLLPRESSPLTYRWQWTSSSPSRLVFARMIAVARGNTPDAGASARSALASASQRGLERLFRDHTRAWAERWDASDIVLDGDPWLQQALRFALYHLSSAANPEDERVSIGARALTGDGYLGHVFWDTDIFMLPFYLHTWPAAARALLMYRYHTLQARGAKAARFGYRGAFYAWESTDTGDEATPPLVIAPDGQIIPVRNGTEEVHISADVAYAVWRYWEATHDIPFLLHAGAEILLETARFWASRATLESDGHYHIRGVIGPDEYHESVDDNAYTNVMAQWNLERAMEVAHLLERRWPEHWATLATRLNLDLAELEQWRDVADRLVTGFDPTTGLFEQFAGYFGLEPVDLAAYEPRTAPMDVLLGRERTQRTQVIKQADVVMLLALLEERFAESVQRANFAYYEPRCGHGSSLSPPIHALVAARLGHLDLAERYLRQSAAIDLDDTMGNTAHGVHIGALGGLWQAMVFGFGGLTPDHGSLRLTPRLLPHWTSLRFPVHWRGRTVHIAIQQNPPLTSVTLARGRPLRIAIGAAQHRLLPGETWVCRHAPLQSDAGRKDAP